jgi:hypothetical protein
LPWPGSVLARRPDPLVIYPEPVALSSRTLQKPLIEF